MPTPISKAALAVLSRVRCEDDRAYITHPNLDRKIYLEVNAVLETLGGKWSRKSKAHVFAEPPEDALDRILTDGVYTDEKRDFEQFFTPPDLAKLVVERAEVKGRRVLEPSAGHGALAFQCALQGAAYILGVEKSDACFKVLNAGPVEKCSFEHRDFLDLIPTSFDIERVVMNPPFSKQQDIEHVSHAFAFLRPGGRLVAIMSAGVSFRTDHRATTFRKWVEDVGGTIEPLPDRSFKASGTLVRTVLLVVDY